ncbi:uncharacterized protein LOC143631129 [Bidens hawaiensis]|uniref:uncharacterized protein LOC143631129 n=1 Tax=Bidens hawaiensis TaxID=980011 RepID=UPI004048EBE8
MVVDTPVRADEVTVQEPMAVVALATTGVATSHVPKKKKKWHVIGKSSSLRCRNYQYHNDSPILYFKWHTDSRRWAIRRVVGRGTYDENLEGWFKRLLNKEWKNDYPNFTLNKGRSYMHPTKVDPNTGKRRKAWRYKMPADHGEPIYHGEPFTANMLYDFVAWEFENGTGRWSSILKLSFGPGGAYLEWAVVLNRLLIYCVGFMLAGPFGSDINKSNPLYLHASDSSTLTVIIIKLKGTDNYTVWANAMLLALQVKNKIGFIDGTCVKYVEDDVLAKQWDRCNSVVLSWILNSISDKLYLGKMFSKSALSVWRDLKETYNKVDGSVVFGLYQKINPVNQNGNSVAEYYHKLNTMWKQFDAMFLMGLDDVYQSVRTSLLTRDPLPTIKTAFSIISREESHKNSSGTSRSQTQNMGCFEIVGYPQGPRPKGSQSFNQMNKSPVSNNVIQNKSSDQSNLSSGTSLTPDQDSLTRRVLVNGDQLDGLYFCGGDSRSFKFDKTIKIIRSDNGSEFVNHQVQHFLRQNGVIHHTYCTHTPQQNGVVERKHRHLLNVARALLFQGGIPLSFCVFQKSVESNESLFVNHLNFFNLYDDEATKESSNELNPDDDLGVNIDRSSEDQQPSSNSRADDETAGSTSGSISDGSSGVDPTRVERENINSSEGTSCQPPLRKSTRNTGFPRKLSDFVVEGKVKYGLKKVVNYLNLSFENMSFVSNLNKCVEPTSYKEASTDVNWVNAMNDEMRALYGNNTWELVGLPKDRKAIGCKRMYKIKYKSNGEIDRYKARLVAKCYSQREGVDFDETFSPVVKMISVRCVISLANDWPLFQLDVNNAFLYGDLNEEVYMKLPEGYFSNDDTRVCRLVKSFYGLKQAPRMWNAKLVSALCDIGFVQSKCDHSLFIKSEGSIFLVLLVYVDDIVLTGNDSAAIENVKQMLKSKFLTKDLGLLKYLLGIEVIRTDQGVYLSQRKYCMELLAEYGMSACKPVNTPIEQNYVVMNACEKDKSALKSVTGLLRYLKKAPRMGILFKKGDFFGLKAFSDSDWAKCLDTRRSVTGYCIFLGSNLVSWESKKQVAVSRPSSEAEYAMCACAEEVIWVANLLKELKVAVDVPVPLHCDNSTAISIAANPVFHNHTKHFEGITIAVAESLLCIFLIDYMSLLTRERITA